MRVDTVPDPRIQDPRDAIIKITSTAICGSDIHLYDGYQPTMESGDILGHENMGEVVGVGSSLSNLKKGDRVVVPFTISCGTCWFSGQVSVRRGDEQSAHDQDRSNARPALPLSVARED